MNQDNLEILRAFDQRMIDAKIEDEIVDREHQLMNEGWERLVHAANLLGLSTHRQKEDFDWSLCLGKRIFFKVCCLPNHDPTHPKNKVRSLYFTFVSPVMSLTLVDIPHKTPMDIAKFIISHLSHDDAYALKRILG